MCVVDKGLFDVIHDELIAKVQSTKAFTAYDITKAVRDSGGQVSHYVVREIVRDWFRYNRYFGFQSKVINLNDEISTIVYFKEGIDPQPYIDDLIQKIANQEQNKEVPIVDTIDKPGVLELIGKQSKSNQNRLHFTKTIVERAGFNPGDKVSVDIKPEGIQVIPYAEDFGIKHTIEKGSLLRLRLRDYKIREYNMYVGEGKLMAIPIPAE